jgi:hypothetical protein
MVITPANHEPLLRPDDLSADAEALAAQAFGDSGGVQGAMPDIGYVAPEGSPCRFPVCLRVVADLAASRRLVDTCAVAPGRVVINTVERVSHHEVGRNAGEQAGNRVGVRTVAAGYSVRACAPDISERSDDLLR